MVPRRKKGQTHEDEEVARSPAPRRSFMLGEDGETDGVTMQDEELIAASAVG